MISAALVGAIVKDCQERQHKMGKFKEMKFECFNSHRFTLTTLSMLVEFSLKVSSLVETLVFENKQLIVGCQTIPFNDMVKIRNFLTKCIESEDK
jgi:hypothetical protein